MSNLKTRCKCYRGSNLTGDKSSFMIGYLEIPVSISTNIFYNCFEFINSGRILPKPGDLGMINKLVTLNNNIFSEENIGETLDFNLYQTFIYSLRSDSEFKHLSPLDSNLVSGLILNPISCTSYVGMSWDNPWEQFYEISVEKEDTRILPVEIQVGDEFKVPGRDNWNRLMELISKSKSKWIEYDSVGI